MTGLNQDERKYFPNPLGSNAEEWFDYAGTLDSNGLEADARRAYEIVNALGLKKLPEEDRPRFYLQYGSTLRNLGEFALALSVLEEGCRLYPDHAALKLFKTFADCSAGKHEEAAKTLLQMVLKVGVDPTLNEYRRSIKYYIDEIVKHP